MIGVFSLDILSGDVSIRKVIVVITEADTCRQFILSKLYATGWTDDQINEQRTLTDGRIIVAGQKVYRRPQKRADYILRYRLDFMIAVIEAKAAYKKALNYFYNAKKIYSKLGSEHLIQKADRILIFPLSK